MRVWRVGTFSMGAALLFLGIILLFSQVFGFKLYQAMISWWPIILVVLGIEILLYLFLSKQEKPILKYDFMSIIFVGVLGMMGIGFAILSSIGLMEKVSDVLERQQQTLDLPAFSQTIDGSISRVVVKAEHHPITIEGSPSKEIAFFGTYQSELRKNEKLIEKPEDILSVQQKGDTLFIDVKALPSQSGPFDSYIAVSATLLIPSGIKLEVDGGSQNIRLKPRTLLSDWSIETSNEVSLYIQEGNDVKVDVTGAQAVAGKEGLWKISEQQNSLQNEGDFQEGTSGLKSATYQTGKGTHRIQVLNAYRVSLSTTR